MDIKLCDSVVVKVVNTKAVSVRGITTTGLTVGLWHGIRDFVVVGLDDIDVILVIDFFIVAQVTIHPWLDEIFIARCSHPRFVKGVYGSEETWAGKKSKTEQMDRRWAEAQQELVAEPGKTASENLPKRKRDCEGKQSDDADSYKQALLRGTYEKDNKVTSTRASNSGGVGGL
ncbi:hypothetical protein Salat_0680200 [Sesamum alatum]|uniref:Uncharacterized protein n=1 Tax=Sesamum alatum TaxID=300844 RepID=A0AAE2CV15_9LAMI|nr:hypothetical protein Salat_0680200 [Sesamum alatum]